MSLSISFRWPEALEELWGLPSCTSLHNCIRNWWAAPINLTAQLRDPGKAIAIKLASQVMS